MGHNLKGAKMGILSGLKKITGFDRQQNTNGNTPADRCLIKIKIRKAEFMILSKFYYRGHTSYKSYMRYVFIGNTKKILEVMQKAKKKASSGCNIDDTYVQFYFDDKHTIFIPFEVFADKKNMTIQRRNTKVWNKWNLVRIIELYPHFEKYDAAMVTESDILNLLFGE